MPCPNMLLVPHLTRFNAMPKHVAGPTPHKVQCHAKHVAGPTPHKVQCHAQTCCWSHTSQGSIPCPNMLLVPHLTRFNEVFRLPQNIKDR